eukprot:m.113756 g.113756  ORF g.113756 m.113756 type:complete len:302 (-) comp16012_c0_seq1:53-958(-)
MALAQNVVHVDRRRHELVHPLRPLVCGKEDVQLCAVESHVVCGVQVRGWLAAQRVLKVNVEDLAVARNHDVVVMSVAEPQEVDYHRLDGQRLHVCGADVRLLCAAGHLAEKLAHGECVHHKLHRAGVVVDGQNAVGHHGARAAVQGQVVLEDAHAAHHHRIHMHVRRLDTVNILVQPTERALRPFVLFATWALRIDLLCCCCCCFSSVVSFLCVFPLRFCSSTTTAFIFFIFHFYSPCLHGCCLDRSHLPDVFFHFCCCCTRLAMLIDRRNSIHSFIHSFVFLDPTRCPSFLSLLLLEEGA